MRVYRRRHDRTSAIESSIAPRGFARWRTIQHDELFEAEPTRAAKPLNTTPIANCLAVSRTARCGIGHDGDGRVHCCAHGIERASTTTFLLVTTPPPSSFTTGLSAFSATGALGCAAAAAVLPSSASNTIKSAFTRSVSASRHVARAIESDAPLSMVARARA